MAVVQTARSRNLYEESGQTPISRKVNSIRPSIVLVGIILFLFIRASRLIDQFRQSLQLQSPAVSSFDRDSITFLAEKKMDPF